MASIPITVLGIAVLLAVVVAMEPVARRLALPLSLVLVIFGAAAGFAIDLSSHPLGASLALSSEAFLYLFLPILLFETAIEIDVRRLLEDIVPIFLLAVVAVMASALIIGFGLNNFSTYSLVACLLTAAIVSTTDPVAVVALFKDISVPHRLTLLVEGESLFNDAAAIAMFSVLMSMLTVGSGDAGDAIVGFLRSFSGGFLVGFGLSLLATQLLQFLPGKRMAEVTVTVAVAYLAFAISEYGFHFSGVVAVVVSALVFAYDGRTRVSPKTWTFLVGTWKQLGYWASGLIFLLAALRIPGLLADVEMADIFLLGVLLVCALAARGLVLYFLMPMMSAVGLAQKVDADLRLVILWGGLRGAISLALALAVVEHPAVPADVKHLVATLVTAFVLITLFVNGLTLRPLIRILGIDRLEPIDRFLRGRAIAHSIDMVKDRLVAAADRYHIEPAARERLAADYLARMSEAETLLEADLAPSAEERLRSALVTAAQREQLLHFQNYQDRIVSGRIVRNLVARAYDLEDRAKSAGREGYEAAAREELGFSLPFRLSVELQRRLGSPTLLARVLADRQESLLVGRAAIHSLLQFAAERIPEMLGHDSAEALTVVLQRRLDDIENALAALRLQYGEFAEGMQVRYLERAALRIEFSEYQRLIDEAVISREVFKELLRDIDARWHTANQRPALDLKLSPQELLVRLPFFQNLDSAFLESIVPLLKPHFVMPGEVIIRKGEKGREMFFLASGAVEVELTSGPRRLGSGDFFGELALLTQAPRAADVVALGFCEMLVMTAGDFASLLDRNPDLKAQVAETARVRLARN
jgi:CPA1 family monovalent cation:H+ antiporter